MSILAAETPAGSQDFDDDTPYEIIDGRRVEKVMGIRQIWLANRLAIFLNRMAFDSRLGVAIVEPLFELGMTGNQQFRPDLAFISESRWASGRLPPSTNAWALVPDLAVEVVSPSNTADEIQGKVVDYLKAGVRLVWVVYTKSPCVQVHDGSGSIRVVDLDGELDGGDVLPGFRLPLATLFGDHPD